MLKPSSQRGTSIPYNHTCFNAQSIGSTCLVACDTIHCCARVGVKEGTNQQLTNNNRR
jgi:hypothetical protein